VNNWRSSFFLVEDCGQYLIKFVIIVLFLHKLMIEICSEHIDKVFWIQITKIIDITGIFIVRKLRTQVLSLNMKSS